MYLKKTKIVATIGPASSSEKMLIQLIKAGVNVFRLNFSHGEHKTHLETLENIRKASKKAKTPVAVLQDLCGPKIRIGDFYQEKITLKKGAHFTLTTKPCTGDENEVFVSYKRLPQEVKKDGFILLDDGKIRLKIVSTSKTKIKCKVLVGGSIRGRRGVNVPGSYLKISSLTVKDKKDLEFGIKHNIDFIALSFVRNAKDVMHLKEILKSKKSDAEIIAKIETEEAVENLDEIINVADGIMVARGDLAVEMPPETVPVLQKRIIRKCNHEGKPVIVATQMLESMISSPVPTRAEVSDVANSILDGADAVMLSAETAVGLYPLDVINIMREVAIKTEMHYSKKRIISTADEEDHERGIVDAVSDSAVNVAYAVDAKLIVALTESGFTARMVSRFKPKQHILVMTPSEKASRRVILSFGVKSFKIKPFKYIAQVLDQVSQISIKNGYAKKGDKIVIIAGVPFGKRGGTNLVMVERV